MRGYNQFKRIAGQGFQNFFRNTWLSIAATAIMLVTLTIILTSFALNMVFGDLIDDITSRVTVSVFLEEGASEDRKSSLKNALEANDNVEAVNFIDKEQAKLVFLEQQKDNPSVIDSLAITGNILPESFEVEVLDLSRVDAVQTISNDPQFDDVVSETSLKEDSRKSISNLARAQDLINLGTLAAAGLFAAISILVIFNTIRMAVFTRSNEIEIMKLIGATPRYIRGPFLFESALYGVFAGIIAVVAVFSALLTVGQWADDDLQLDPTIDFFSNNWPWIFLATLALGISIGLISCTISMSRYLRLKHW